MPLIPNIQRGNSETHIIVFQVPTLVINSLTLHFFALPLALRPSCSSPILDFWPHIPINYSPSGLCFWLCWEDLKLRMLPGGKCTFSQFIWGPIWAMGSSRNLFDDRATQPRSEIWTPYDFCSTKQQGEWMPWTVPVGFWASHFGRRQRLIEGKGDEDHSSA